MGEYPNIYKKEKDKKEEKLQGCVGEYSWDGGDEW